MKNRVINQQLMMVHNPIRSGVMRSLAKLSGSASLLAMMMALASPASASIFVQCPGDTDGDAVIDNPDPNHPTAKCMHLGAGDGYTNMADGYLQYIFGFSDLTGILPDNAVDEGIFAAQASAPSIVLDQGQEFYLTLSNVGMANRPDLSDPHTVHFHGFPNAASVFDGVPDASVSVNMGASMTYYYNVQEPGTYLYHCHVEAAEHMEMGMQGNLYVRPKQNGTSFEYPANSGRVYNKFVYNDGNGSTGYDVEMPLQISGYDPDFHDASMNTQPLPFADLNDRYHMINGRGYPDTVQPDNYYALGQPGAGLAQDQNGGRNSQPISSKISVVKGQRLLLRLTNMSITHFFTMTTLGLPMEVVGMGARELSEKYQTASVNLGGGESYDVIVDTLDVEPGSYYFYVTELNYLSNNQENFGGPMTEIVVTAN